MGPTIVPPCAEGCSDVPRLTFPMHAPFRLLRRLLAGLGLVLIAGRLCAQAPVITTNPLSQTNSIGALVSFTVEATGDTPLIYRWFFNNALISTYTNGIISFPISSTFDSGIYFATVSNRLGMATSAPATLTVLGPPAFTTNPASQTIYVGQSVTFTSTVLSAVPVTYTWLFNGAVIANATNSYFAITNTVTNSAGFYSVQANNQYGTTTSRSAQLVVNPLPSPSLLLGTLTVDDQVRVPVLYTANSAESRISFSVAFNPQVLTNAAFEPAFDPVDSGSDSAHSSVHGRVRPASLPPDTTVETDTSLLSAGRLGITLDWGTNSVSPGPSAIGLLTFDLVEGRTQAFEGALGLTNVPVSAVFSPAIDGNTNILLNPMNPQIITAGGFTLNRQTGFLQQVLLYGNPGNTFVENTRLTVAGLGRDSLTNLIALANAQGLLLTPPLPYVDMGAIAPAEVREALLEYYVTDRVTAPTPVFSLYATPAFVPTIPSGTILTNSINRTANGVVMVEFPTYSDRRYYIQYSPTLSGFTNGAFQTSLPPVLGTGSRRQWLDTGPPRTTTLPVGESRFYRVLEVQ